MTKRKYKGPMTAQEHADILEADPEWCARRDERERKRQKRSDEIGENERPLVEALNAAGCHVTSVWDLVNRDKKDYDDVVPILGEHLERDYWPEILEGIARAMAVGVPAMPYRPIMIRMFCQKPLLKDNVRDGLAIAIDATTGPHNVWETIELLRDGSLGENRLFMLHGMRKSKDPFVRQAILDLRISHPELALEIGSISWVKKLDKEAKTDPPT